MFPRIPLAVWEQFFTALIGGISAWIAYRKTRAAKHRRRPRRKPRQVHRKGE